MKMSIGYIVALVFSAGVVFASEIRYEVPSGSKQSLNETLGSDVTALVKAGSGTLSINIANPSFAGVIEVKEGILEVKVAGAVGKGSIVVSDGAALHVTYSAVWMQTDFKGEVKAEGEGPDGGGAVYYSGQGGGDALFEKISLTGAATLGGTRYGAKNFDFDGSTLTWKGTRLAFNNTRISNFGGMILDTAGDVCFEKSPTFDDTCKSATACITVKRGTICVCDLTVPVPLALKAECASMIHALSGSGMAMNVWAGPVETAAGTEFKLQANGVASSLRIAGAVSGGGKVSATGAGTVILDNENNSWTGGTVVSAGFLLALSPSTLPGYDINGSVVAGPWTEIGGVAMNVGSPVPGANVTATWADDDIAKLFASFGFWNAKAHLAYHVPEGATFASSYAPSKRFTSIGKGELRLLSSAASTADVRVESGRVAVDSGEKEGAIGEILLKGEGIFEMRSGLLAQSSGAFNVGGASGGGIWQTGGEFQHNDTSPVKLAADEGARGYWFMDGGSLALAGGLDVGSGGGAFGFFLQKGGEVSFQQKSSVNPVLTLGNGGDAVLAIAGGVFDTKAFSTLGWPSYQTVKMGNGEVGNTVLAVSGADAVFKADKFLMGGFDGAQTNIVALGNGGIFEAGRFYTGTNSDNTEKYLKPFNVVLSDGGVIRPSGSWSWNDISADNYLRNPSRCVLFEGGLTVDTSLLSAQSTISLDFEPPSGKGFCSISLPAEAMSAAYSCAARIVISDSTGWGAVAYADFDKTTGHLTEVKIVSPGCDYSDAPTVAVESPDGKTFYSCAFTLTDNVSGGFTKRGAQILEVYGRNTTRGTTVVESGMLKIRTEQAAPAESVVRVRKNAELQLVWSVKSLRAAGGAGTISRISNEGGTVTLTQGIVAYAEDMLSGEATVFTDGVKFADGAVVGVADAEKLQGRQGRFLVARAVNGTIGGALPLPSPSLPDAANYKVVLSADAKRLYLSNMTGMSVIVR